MMKKVLFIGAGAAVCGIAAGAAVSHVITKRLVQVAIDRDGAKNMHRMQARVSNSDGAGDFMASIAKCGERLLEWDTEKVEITSRDGLKLVGHWYPCQNSERVIVAMHGWRSAWYKDFGLIADFWRDSGCSILFAEQRGQNASEGDYITFGYMERYDCLDWINWVRERVGDGAPIYLAGVSMGASTVLMSVGLELPEGVRGVVADCGFTSAHGIWSHVVKNNLKLGYKFRGRAIDRICLKKMGAHAREITTLDAMRNAKIPILFIHGAADSFVPVTMTYENYEACASPKELFIVPGASHGESYFKEKDEYERRVEAFWKKYD